VIAEGVWMAAQKPIFDEIDKEAETEAIAEA
jgi:hypothetical protein